jgi:hypothetical protein
MFWILLLFLVCSMEAYKVKGFDGMGFKAFMFFHKVMN